jgi:hypothetical protein
LPISTRAVSLAIADDRRLPDSDWEAFYARYILLVTLPLMLLSCSSLSERRHMELIDLGALFDAHVTHEFVDRDVDATMNTMTAEPYLLHLPMLS